MLEFCPYDFEPIDPNNLAYEAVFFGTEAGNKYTWEKVKEIVGMEKVPKYIAEKSKRRMKFFNIGENDVGAQALVGTPLIFRASNKIGGKSGLYQFIENFIENSHGRNAIKSDEYDDEYDEYDDYDDEYSENNCLKHKMENGEDIFVDDMGTTIMKAIPCCPKCHNRLPVGWNKAEDFRAIALMAPTTGGKTTFLYSMMHDNWKTLNALDTEGMGSMYITSAHWDDDLLYKQLKDAAEQMCKPQGNCPQHTNKTMRIPPIFFNLKYQKHLYDEEHSVIFGIYDNAGEILSMMSPNDPRIHNLLDKMSTAMFLFDPKDLNITLPEKLTNIKQNLKECRVLSSKEQGEFQVANSGKVKSAQDLLKEFWREPEKKEKKPMGIYTNYTSLVINRGLLRKLQQMHFLGILVKSDLLRQTEAVKNANGKYDTLFDANNNNGMLDISAIFNRSSMVEEMIGDFRLFGDYDLDRIQTNFGEVSWHCISALGCDAELGGNLLGEYNPIRVAEPIALCILRLLQEKGWLK